jgi:hypothetical protein
MSKVVLDVSMSLDGSRPVRTSGTSRAGPRARCTTWVGDDPNAATNLRFRTTSEN